MDARRAVEIFSRIDETMAVARLGYEDLTGESRQRRMVGLRNLIVFGRSVTFVIQNLKSAVGETRFDEWYMPIQEELKADPVMKYFVTLRNDLEKKGRLPVAVSAHIHRLSFEDLNKLPRPPGATSLFIGDSQGGSGWEIEFADGSKERYYIELPASVAEVRQYFHELPVPDDHELKNRSIQDLAHYFLMRLDKVVESARLEFLDEVARIVNGRRLPSYISVVK